MASRRVAILHPHVHYKHYVTEPVLTAPEFTYAIKVTMDLALEAGKLVEMNAQSTPHPS